MKSLPFLLALVFLVVGCNDRSRGRVPGDSSVAVDSSSGDGATDGGPGDSETGTIDTGVNLCTPDVGLSFGVSGIMSETTVGRMNLRSGSCGGDSAPELVAFWRPDVAGTWVIDTYGSSFDTVLYAWLIDESGTFADCSTELACSDDTADSMQSEITLDLSIGDEIFIVIDGAGAASGDVVLSIAPAE